MLSCAYFISFGIWNLNIVFFIVNIYFSFKTIQNLVYLYCICLLQNNAEFITTYTVRTNTFILHACKYSWKALNIVIMTLIPRSKLLIYFLLDIILSFTSGNYNTLNILLSKPYFNILNNYYIISIDFR